MFVVMCVVCVCIPSKPLPTLPPSLQHLYGASESATTYTHPSTHYHGRFRDEPRVRFAIISVTAGGVGLDFSSATLVVFAELPDDPAIILQVRVCACVLLGGRGVWSRRVQVRVVVVRCGVEVESCR